MTDTLSEEVDPDIHWWQGPTRCTICGHCDRSVVPIPRDQDEPIVPLECAGCGNMTAEPNPEDPQ